MYPKNDNEFTYLTIERADAHSVTFDDGWSIGIPSDFTGKIEAGMSARQYGKGIWYSVRGLFIDGQRVWYRTPEEQDRWEFEQLYGASAQDILDRWDAGRSVLSIEMGGLGPGYEQSIQILSFEVLRICLKNGYDTSRWREAEGWKNAVKQIEEELEGVPIYHKLGLSGAQVGAGVNLGARIYRDGPHGIKAAPEDRKIHVSKRFPSVD